MPRILAFRSRFLSFLMLASLFLFAPHRANAGNELTLHSFNPQAPGSFPGGGLIADSAGNLYGETSNGGTYGYGTVFEFIPNQQGGWTEEVLYNFRAGADGADPQGGVVFDRAGNLYGTTIFGGLGNGTVFELIHNPDGTWTRKTLLNIDDGEAADLLQSGLAFDQNGNLYAATATGGAHGGGTVFELSPTSSGEWKQSVLQSFYSSGSGGNHPIGPFVIDRAGNVFGVAIGGGYGCSCGLVFELSPTSGGQWKETVIHNFVGGSDGESPMSGLISDEAGNLYGTTFYGGTGPCSRHCGLIYELSPAGNGSWTASVLYEFQGNHDGANPEYSLALDRAGNLYGVTYFGGGLGFCESSGCGTVFELTPDAGQWSESVLWRFDNNVDGYDVSSGVFINADGRILGELFYGHDPGQNGMLFSLTNTGSQWTLHSVTGFEDSDGAAPETALVADSRGNLYGTTAVGGSFGIGAVFEMTFSRSGGWNEQMIYSFPSGGHTVNGTPIVTTLPSSLILDAAGNLYGEEWGGGFRNAGTVYELSPATDGTWTEKTLYSFAGGAAGSYPSGGLIMDPAGNLYGTTQYGGLGSVQGSAATGNGIVFELIPSPTGPWTKKTLYEFAGYPNDGAQPEASLIFDPAGNLYGTTFDGGGSPCTSINNNKLIIGCGTAFELTLQNGVWQETMLHSFLGGNQDGQFPEASLVRDSSGNLYGTTIIGGSGYGVSNGSGTVFELSSAGAGEWKETILVDFPQGSGQVAPFGNLIFDASGNLYGTTSQGNSGFGYPAGSVFELSPNSGGAWNYQELYSFTDLGVGATYAGVIFGPDGYLYGTTWNGGNFSGTVFAITQ